MLYIFVRLRHKNENKESIENKSNNNKKIVRTLSTLREEKYLLIFEDTDMKGNLKENN